MEISKEKLRVLFIAGGLWQRFYLSYLKELGHEVTIVNPITTETTQIADYHIEKDVKDIQGILDNLAFVPDIICSDQCEVAMPTICRVAQTLNKRSPSKESIELFTNKISMCRHAINQKIPTPEYKELKCYEANPFPAPFVIKPVGSTSSRGFFKCNEKLQIEEFEFARKFGNVMVQRFVEGIELTLEGICQNYKHKTVAVSSKEHFRPGIASRLKYPADIPADMLRQIIQDNDKFVEASGYEFGITHAEYIVDIAKNKYWFLEIAGRGGGCGISSHIIKAVSGNDTFDVYTKLLMGETSTLKEENNLCILQFFEFLPNDQKVNLASMSKQIERNSDVLLFKFNFLDHQYLKPATTDQDRHALIIATSEKAIDEAREIFKKGGLRCCI